MFLSTNFLGIPEAENTLEGSRVVVLPVPYERTVSYGVGTRNGPAAILEASRYVELYDDELDEEPSRLGIHTLPPWLPDRMEPEAAVRSLEGIVSELLAQPRFVLTLGGEHAIAAGPIKAHLPRYPTLSILHFDAHGDLRDEYEGDRYSHACAARRFVELGLPTVHVGIRSISREELDYAREKNLLIISNRRLRRYDSWIPEALERLTGAVYVTFDVDFFDGSLVPGTGTPEPGGGTWEDALEIFRRVAAERRIVGADVVEHAPLAGNRAPDFLVAKLCYKLLGYAFFPEKVRSLAEAEAKSF
ncbi:MAG TPA: agmatinase [Thermoanaerobaculia bacterium]|nr:agmatinase [Thermoanaerobaculia bacterium]